MPAPIVITITPVAAVNNDSVTLMNWTTNEVVTKKVESLAAVFTDSDFKDGLLIGDIVGMRYGGTKRLAPGSGDLSATIPAGGTLTLSPTLENEDPVFRLGW